jgi:hypothetical protein
MFTNDKIRLYIFLFLAFCVLSSKNILIYNEETLVALSFFCFIFFVFQYFGATIKDSLNERSQIIQHELQNFINLKESSFNELLKEHQKVSGLVNAMKTLDIFTNRELKTLNVHGEKALINMFIHQMQHKLKTLSFSKLMLQQKLQFLLSENVLSNVLVAFQQSKTEKIKSGISQESPNNKIIKNAIQLLISKK